MFGNSAIQNAAGTIFHWCLSQVLCAHLRGCGFESPSLGMVVPITYEPSLLECKNATTELILIEEVLGTSGRKAPVFAEVVSSDVDRISEEKPSSPGQPNSTHR